MRALRKLAIRLRGGIKPGKPSTLLTQSVEGVARVSRGSLKLEVSIEAPPGSRGFWINAGLAPRDLEFVDRVDPDSGLYRAKWVSLEEEVSRIELSGSLTPFAGPWGFSSTSAILRYSLLWYPASCDPKTVIVPLMCGLHRFARLELVVRDYGCVASSLYASSEGGRIVLEGVGSVPPIDVVLVDGWARAYSVSGIELRLVVEKGIEVDPVVVRECARACVELVKGLGLELPYTSIDVAIHRGGGFTNARLVSLSPSSARSRASILVSMIRGFYRMWWGSIVRPRDPRDAWLFEAIPEYLTTVSLLKLGLSELYQARLNAVFSEAFKLLSSILYVPPNSIALPLTRRGLKSWRFVGEAVLHMIGTCVGTNNLIEALVRIASECQRGSRKPWVGLEDVVKEVERFGDPTPVLKRFKLLKEG